MAKIDKIKNKKMQTYTSLGKAEINELTNQEKRNKNPKDKTSLKKNNITKSRSK